MGWIQRKPVFKVRSTDSTIEKLCNIRGIEGNINKFLNPDASVLHSPYLLKNIEVVAERIIKALKNGERICVSVDCDSDGIFSTATMVRYLRQFTDNIYYVYSERSKGHGVDHQLEHIEPDTDLIIILDSSTNSAEACKKLQGMDIDVLVLDHHAVEEENPYAIIVNPQLDDYPNKDISGCGVVYKVIQVIDDTIGSGTVDELIDLVGCGMYADMMSCAVLENRYIMIQAMQNINNQGILAILKVNNRDKYPINSGTLGFTISPMINGSARMESINLAIQLLLTNDEIEALDLAKKIKKLNDERRTKQRDLVESYSATLDDSGKIIIAIDEEASSGFNGLVANTLAERYKRPAIVVRAFKDEEGTCKGSFRSYAGFPMKKFLGKLKFQYRLIDYALGHEFAGGVGFKEGKLSKIKEKIEYLLKDTQFDTSLEYDMELDAEEITEDFAREVMEFDYLTGNGFPQARFLIRDIEVEGREVIGNNNTIKIKCSGMDLMKFNTNEYYAEDIYDEDCFMNMVDAIGTVNVNEFSYWKKIDGRSKQITIITNQVFLDDYRKVE